MENIMLEVFAGQYLKCEPGDGKADRLIEKYAKMTGLSELEAHRALADAATDLLPTEYNHTLSTPLEVEVATEFGDGTQFELGEIVLHHPMKGTFRRIHQALKKSQLGECPDGKN